METTTKHTCLICGHLAAETRSAPLQCLHCGGLGFFWSFLAPRPVPRPPRPEAGDSLAQPALMTLPKARR